jgi:ABC-type lipoprotein release transport system permease subunit
VAPSKAYGQSAPRRPSASCSPGSRTIECDLADDQQLGADGGGVSRLILVDGLRVTAAGLLLGGGVAWVGARALRHLLYAIEPHDPATFVAVAAMLLAVSALTTYVPARRAGRVDPIVSLRAE